MRHRRLWGALAITLVFGGIAAAVWNGSLAAIILFAVLGLGVGQILGGQS